MCLKQSHIKRDVWHQKAAYPVCQISKPPQGFYIPDISIRQAPIILVCLFNKVCFWYVRRQTIWFLLTSVTVEMVYKT